MWDARSRRAHSPISDTHFEPDLIFGNSKLSLPSLLSIQIPTRLLDLPLRRYYKVSEDCGRRIHLDE